jgi:hypothetical protein
MTALASAAGSPSRPPADADRFALLRHRLSQFLAAEGAFDKIHDRSTRRTLGAHLLGTFDLLRHARCSANVCAAGSLHSIYGTFIYRSVTVPPTQQRRRAIAAAFGRRAEHLTFLFHACQRPLDLESGVLVCRAESARFTWSERDLRDLRLIEAANRIEQGLAFDTLPRVHRVWREQTQFALGQYAIELQPRRPLSSGEQTPPILHLSCRGYNLSVALPILPNDQRIGRWLASCSSTADQSSNSPANFSPALPPPDAFIVASEVEYGMPPSGFEMLNSYRNTTCCDVSGPGGSVSSAASAFDRVLQHLSRLCPCVRGSPTSRASMRLAIEPAYRTTSSPSANDTQPISLDLLRAGDERAAASLVERLTTSGWAVVRAGADFASVMAAAYASMLALKALVPGADPCHRISRCNFDEGRYVGLSHDNGRTFINWREGCEGAGGQAIVMHDCTGTEQQRASDGCGNDDVGSMLWPADAEAQRRDLATAHEMCFRASEDILAVVLSRVPCHPGTTVASLLRPAVTVRSTTDDRAAELLHDARETAYGSSVQRFLMTRDKPPESAPTSFSSGQHADMGILTLGPLSTHPALEIVDRATGSVVDAEAGLSAPLGDCVLLAGETLEFVTGGAVKACIHRVPWVDRQQDAPPRRSAPFFLRAHPAARLRHPKAQLDMSCRELMELHVLSFRPWRLRAFDALNAGDW